MLPELDGRNETDRADQATIIASVLDVLAQRAETLNRAAREVMEMPVPTETVYAPLSTADAVIRYAGNFVPSWAGAIAIDLLPGVLVFILAVTQSAIRTARGETRIEDSMTLMELRAALNAVGDIEANRAKPPTEADPRPAATKVESLKGGSFGS